MFYTQGDILLKEEIVPCWWFYGIKDKKNQTDELTVHTFYPAADVPLLVEKKSKYDSPMSLNAFHPCCDSDESQKFQELHTYFELVFIFIAEEFRKR